MGLQHSPLRGPWDRTASAQAMDLEMDPVTSAGGRRVWRRKAIPRAHLTFVIDCSRGKRLSLLAPPVLAPPVPPPPVRPPAPAPHRGPAPPPVKTFILFCGGNQPHLTQEAPLGEGHGAQARGTPSARGGAAALASAAVSPPRPRGAPEAKGSPMKPVSARCSAWGAVKGSLKGLLSSCVCGQAD